MDPLRLKINGQPVPLKALRVPAVRGCLKTPVLGDPWTCCQLRCQFSEVKGNHTANGGEGS